MDVDSGEHGHGGEVVEGGRQLEKVEEKEAAALRSRFADGGDAARHRGKWLLVKARNDAGLARLESDHVESLRSVLGGTGLPQCLMTAWFGRRCEASKEMQTDGGLAVVGSSVRVFKAKPDECFGDKSQYIAFGVGDRSRPCIKAKLQRDARKKAMANAATAPPPPLLVLPLLLHYRRRSHRRLWRRARPALPRDFQVRPKQEFAEWRIPCLAALALSHCPEARSPKRRRAFLFFPRPRLFHFFPTILVISSLYP